MTDSFEISAIFPAVTAQQIYKAWLDSAAHTAFTGSPARIDQQGTAEFTAWDGYISGKTQEAEPFHRILQSWRTTEFPEDSPDSRLEILIEDLDSGAQVTLVHSGIPAGQGKDYLQGWEEYYFEPMKRYFSIDEGSSIQE